MVTTQYVKFREVTAAPLTRENASGSGLWVVHNICVLWRLNPTMLYLETAWKSRYAHFISSEYGDRQAAHQLDPTRVISFVTRDCEMQITNKKYSSVSGFMGLPTRVCAAAGGSTSYTSISIKWAIPSVTLRVREPPVPAPPTHLHELTACAASLTRRTTQLLPAPLPRGL